MHGTITEQTGVVFKSERNILQRHTAESCSPGFGRICKGLWPTKTAENLAARVGCSVRAAAYQIAGDNEPSARSIQVIVDECIPKRKSKQG
jgi:hypothetical protein